MVIQIREPMRALGTHPRAPYQLTSLTVKTALFFVTRVDASPCRQQDEVFKQQAWLKQTTGTAGNYSRGPKGPDPPFSSSSSHPGSASAHPTPALVARAQGGLTLGLERGELGADFTSLGNLI